MGWDVLSHGKRSAEPAAAGGVVDLGRGGAVGGARGRQLPLGAAALQARLAGEVGGWVGGGLRGGGGG